MWFLMTRTEALKPAATEVIKLEPIVELEARPEVKSYDIDKLAYAVAMAETKDCTLGAGRYNNCFGIMHWPNGKRTLRRFESKEASYAAFKELWLRKYRDYPNQYLAKCWVNGCKSTEIPYDWIRNVNHYYNQP
jgi:hypothetical protein